ncbi:Appr-1-p processing protein [Streptomyces sp. NBC_01275]|uniref:macro domain-containing protein n=1 Tax=Streptomyces sp. NBC_01275 TaxID=2903807 RepID=UPI00225AB309|nr:Appr-1-p processing protein [Streptomyces sp. NBC_01275]MCX4764289.1 Appr-1-p processing protein [Streptomyces sp. NBC_01275]
MNGMNPDGLPDRADLVRELRHLRRGGLPALQALVPEALRAVTLHAGYADGEDDLADGAERLIRAAAERLGADDLIGRAAQCTFGLLPGRRGDPAADRRRAAALVYGVTSERFRHSQERQVVEQLAGAVLAEAREPRGARAPRPTATGARPQQTPGARPAVVPRTGLPGRAGNRPVTVHISPIELLRDIDVLVSSENVHLEMSKSFRPTVSGALRRSAVVGCASEGPVADVLADELAAWVRARPGVLPLRPGTIVPTGPGALAARGVRRVYHAALAVPDGLAYRVDPQHIATAVTGCFARARQDRADGLPGLRSICFPLLGAGRGGLDRRTSVEWLRWAIEDALTADPDWSVHVVTRYPEAARLFEAVPPEAPEG